MFTRYSSSKINCLECLTFPSGFGAGDVTGTIMTNFSFYFMLSVRLIYLEMATHFLREKFWGREQRIWGALA